jgi:GT2 family glycosyltransferase
MPTYAPDAAEEPSNGRPPDRLTLQQISDRINTLGEGSRTRPYVYMDAIDSIIGSRPDIQLVVGDAKSSDIVRSTLARHHKNAGGYELCFYPDKMSQWELMNDILRRYAAGDTRYIVYTSSDIIWPMDWVAEAVKEFEKDPKLQILFPTVNRGDMAIPIQVAAGPDNRDLIDPADYMDCVGMAAARAPCLNAYAIIFRYDFFLEYGGYMDLFRNCFTESFLYYMAEAMGGKMRLCPRAWVYHHNGVDVWIGEGGFYHYTAEKPVFDKLMDEVQEARNNGKMTVDFLKRKLYIQ